MSSSLDSQNLTLGSLLKTRAYPCPKTLPRLDVETLPKPLTCPRSHYSTLDPKPDCDMVLKPELEPNCKTQPQLGLENSTPSLNMDLHPNFDLEQVSKLWLWYQIRYI